VLADLLQIAERLSSMVVSPPSMLPWVGWLAERSLVLKGSTTSSRYACQVPRNLFATSGVLARLAETCSAPVNSEVPPKQVVAPRGPSLSIRLPTVGFAARPEVVSDSPHVTDTRSSATPHGSRR
jgi:hypothetical protein